METVGIVCEYNPLHLGHRKQFEIIRKELGEDTAIVCLMSGNYVQRGAPAIFHKSLRAKAAVLSGADLVVEMPMTTSLSSAEGFAAGSVAVLGRLCDKLCFGAENADSDLLQRTARTLLDPSFSDALHKQLDQGLSFPAARQKALEDMGCDSSLLGSPNNILAVEYCKAIESQHLSLAPMPVFRDGSYHDTDIDPENPSATALRLRIGTAEDWLSYIPEAARPIFENAAPHSLHAGERAVLAKLRSMEPSDFEALPFGSEGLWRKLMHAVKEKNTLEDIATAVKSKRYTRSRIDRMILCAFLGITEAQMQENAPYVRVLALNKRGGAILRQHRDSGFFRNIGENTDHPYQQREEKWEALYSLFAQGNAVSRHSAQVYFHK